MKDIVAWLALYAGFVVLIVRFFWAAKANSGEE